MTRAILGILLVGCVLFSAAVPPGAQAKTDKPETADESAVRQLGKRWEEAWNKHDVDAMASLLSDDVEFITVRGPEGWLKGRKQFTEDHAWKHKTRFADSVWVTKEVHVRFLRPDLALARVLWETKGDKVPHRKHGEAREGIFGWVVEKRDGKWLVVASQNTEAMPALLGQ
jgi:uncharacterized protein (TIGR02246 family)